MARLWLPSMITERTWANSSKFAAVVRSRASFPRNSSGRSMTHESAFVPPALPSCGQFDIALPRLMDRFLIDKPYFRKVRSGVQAEPLSLKSIGRRSVGAAEFSIWILIGPVRSGRIKPIVHFVR